MISLAEKGEEPHEQTRIFEGAGKTPEKSSEKGNPEIAGLLFGDHRRPNGGGRLGGRSGKKSRHARRGSAGDPFRRLLFRHCPRQRGAYQDEKRRQYAVRRAGSHRLSHLVSPARDGGRAPLFGCDRARRAVDSPLRRTRRAFILVVGGRRRGLRPLLYGRDGRRGSAFGVVRHGVRRNHAPRTARKKSAPLPVDDGGQMAEGHQKMFVNRREERE